MSQSYNSIFKVKLLLLTLLAGLAWAQPAIQTQLFKTNSLQSAISAVTIDSSGNIFAVGQAGPYDAFLVKMTPDFQVAFIADLQVTLATVASSIGVDPSGNVYITGSTTASILPATPDAIQSQNGNCVTGIFTNGCPSDAFLIKADGSNGNILYATYLGGRYSDAGTALALGPDGSVYLAGTTYSPDFPVTAGALITVLPASPAGFLAHISADGKALLTSTYWNGAPQALTVDGSGAVYLTGQTAQAQPGTPGAYQIATNPVSLMTSIDDGSSWTNLSVPSQANWVDADLTNSGVLYAATPTGVIRSGDSGATWTSLGGPLAAAFVDQVRVNPTNGSTLYAIAETDTAQTSQGPVIGAALWKSSDAGQTWVRLVSAPGGRIAIDQNRPDNLYLTWIGPGVSFSHDGGATWVSANRPLDGLVVDAANGDTIYSGSRTNLQYAKSMDSGVSWTSFGDSFRDPYANVGATPIFASGSALVYGLSVLFPSQAGGTTYAGDGMRRSSDGGQTWSSISQVPATAGFFDSNNPNNLYIVGPSGLFFSPDLGNTWLSLRANMDNPKVSEVTVAPDGTLFAVATPQPAAFLAKLDSGISTISYFTCYGGSGGVTPQVIAIDGQGRPVIAGVTTSRDLPVTNGQPAPEYENGFVARFSADGSTLDFATTLGGGLYDTVTSLALLPGGGIIAAGVTNSTDFPITPNADQPQMTSSHESGFLTALADDGETVYSSLLGGSSPDGIYASALNGRQLFLGGSVSSSDFPGLPPGLGQIFSPPFGFAALAQVDLTDLGLAPPVAFGRGVSRANSAKP